MTDQIKLEDTLIDYMEIIISMNAKMNNHIHQTKMSIRELDEKSGGRGASRGGGLMSAGLAITGGNPASLDMMKMQQRFVQMDTEIEKLRLDVISSKQNEKMRQEEMEAFFKKASLEYFNKLRDT